MRPEAPRPSSPRIQRGDKGGNEMTLEHFLALAQCVISSPSPRDTLSLGGWDPALTV